MVDPKAAPEAVEPKLGVLRDGPVHAVVRVSKGRSRQNGYVLLTFAASATVLVGFMALVVDAGMLELYKRRAQTAADAGALELGASGSSNVVAAATQDVTTNGFTSGVNGATVTVNFPPLSGNYAGNSKYVEVIVTTTNATSLMRVLGFQTMTASARAVAGLGTSPYCVVVLDPGATPALYVSSTVNANCNVMVNSSSSSDAADGNYSWWGGGCINAASVSMVGGPSYNFCSNPSPQTGASATTDPLAYLSVPSVGACNFTNYSVSSGTISPGVYCNGLHITSSGWGWGWFWFWGGWGWGNSGGTVSLNPGTYIINGGDLRLDNNAAMVGTGVTFVLTSTNSNQYPPGQVNISDSGNTSLSAPTSGSLEGILIYYDQNINGQNSTISGTSTTYLNGAIYLPQEALSYCGGNITTPYTSLVVQTLSFSSCSSTTTINSDYSGNAHGNPLIGNQAAQAE